MSLERMTAAEFRAMHQTVATAAPGKGGIRLPKLPQPNKIEAEWIELCKREHPCATVLYEPFTLRLKDGSRYTPDVLAVVPDDPPHNLDGGNELICYEVKGPYEHNDRWKIKFKQARAAFPWIRFRIAKKTDKSIWSIIDS